MIPAWMLRGVEWTFTLFGSAVCVWVAIFTASQQFNNLWPTPGLFLFEILLLAVVALTSRVVDVGPVKMDYGAISWMTGGVLLAFVILAGFSIGPSLFPAMLAFWLAAAAGDLRQHRSLLTHLALALVAAVFQGALIGLLLLLSSAYR
jgi:hypothetical protein